MPKTAKKVKVAALSIISNSTLIVLKIIAGLLSGSVSIISEAIHSGMDLLASIIAFLSVRVSSKPADKEHPYGHGKIENVSGVIEGLLILIAALLIIREAVEKILHPGEIEQAWIAVAVMIISGLVNIFVSKALYKVAKEEDSIALEADALHLKTDVITSFGVAGGILLIKLTGISMLDPIAAILVALLIIKEAWSLCKNAFNPLLDSNLPDEDVNRISEVMVGYSSQIITYQELRTRKSGNVKYIDFSMTVFKELTVEETYGLTKKIERDLEKAVKNTNVSIRLKPGLKDQDSIEVELGS